MPFRFALQCYNSLIFINDGVNCAAYNLAKNSRS